MTGRRVISGQSEQSGTLPTFLNPFFQSVAGASEGYFACRHTADIEQIHLRPGAGFPDE